MMETFTYCPQCGKPALSFIQSRSVTCDLCGFHYFFNVSAAVVGLIKNERKELLLTRRNHSPFKDKLDLPGGFMEFDETAEAALCREIKEETNLNVEKMQYLGALPGEYLYDGILYQVVNIVFCCSVEDFSNICLSDEISEYVFLAKDEINLDHIGIKAIKTIVKKFG